MSRNGLERSREAFKSSLNRSKGLNHFALNQEKPMSACVYILHLRSGGLYVGCAANIQKRYQDHLKGQACRTTKLDPPVSIVYSENYSDFHVVISIYRYLGDIWFSGK